MAKSSFTSELLVKCWKQVSDKGGTRNDVVALVMAKCGATVDEKSRKKWYGNVTQRYKALLKAGVNFTPLKDGQSGPRLKDEDIKRFNELLAG